MSVYCDKILGYSMDIEEDLSLISKEEVDEILYNLKDDNRFGLTPYDSKELDTDCITILYDDMNGEFTKLFYIFSVEKYADDDDDKFVESINSFLSGLEVPSKIGVSLLRTYSSIFGCVRSKTIKPEYIQFYH